MALSLALVVLVGDVVAVALIWAFAPAAALTNVGLMAGSCVVVCACGVGLVVWRSGR